MNNHVNRIYIACEYTDLRKGIDGYASIIESEYHLSPVDKSLYIFCNRSRNKIKCLYWDGSGFWLLYKRLETGHFKWKRNEEENKGVIEITEQQLRWLLEGLKIEQKTTIREVHGKYV